MDFTIRILFIVQKNQRDSRKSYLFDELKKRNSHCDGSKWLTRTAVGLCDGLSSLLAQLARQNGRSQDIVWTNVWCKIRWTIDPVRSQSQPQAHLFERLAKAASRWQKKMLPGILMGYVLRARAVERMVKRFARR